MRTPVLGALVAATTTAGANRWLAPGGGDLQTTEHTSTKWIVPADGYVYGLSISGNNPGAAGRVWSLMVNGVESACSLTITSGNTAGLDTSHTVAVSAGDTVSIVTHSIDSTTATSQIGAVAHGFMYQSGTIGRSGLFSGSDGGNVSASVTNYMPLVGQGKDTTAANVECVIPAPGVIKNARVNLAGTPGSGKNYVATLVLNGTPTTLTVTVADTATSGSDTTHTVTVAAGDRAYWQIVPSGTPTARAVGIGVEFDPSTVGESIVTIGTSNSPSTVANTNNFETLNTQQVAWNTSSTRESYLPYAAKVTRAAARITTAPGTSNWWEFWVADNRQNIATFGDVTIANTATAVFGAAANGVRPLARLATLSAGVRPIQFAGSAPPAPGPMSVGFALLIGQPNAQARAVPRAATTAVRVFQITSAASRAVPRVSADAAPYGTNVVAAARARAVPTAAATVVAIRTPTAAARGMARAKVRVAPFFRAAPVVKVGQQAGLPAPYNANLPASPYYTRFNRTEDWDISAGDLGLSWDNQDGTFRTAFGDSFGSSWTGPFTAGQAAASTTVALASAGLDLSTLDGTQSIQINSGVGPSPGFVAVQTGTGHGPGGWATIYYETRTGLLLNNCHLITGDGILTSGMALRWNDPRTGGGWRSTVIARSSDADMRDGYVFDSFVSNAGGVAIDVSLSAKDTPTFTDAYPDAGMQIVSIAESGYLITVVTSTPHGFTKPGQMLTVLGTSVSRWNGNGGRVWDIPNSTTVRYFDPSFGINETGAANTGFLYKARAVPADHRTLPDGTRNPTGGVSIPNWNGTGVTRQFCFYMCYFGLGGLSGLQHPSYASFVYTDDDWATINDGADAGVYFQSDSDFLGVATIGQMQLGPDGWLYALSSELIIGDPNWVPPTGPTPRTFALRVRPNTDLMDPTKYEWWDGTRYVANGQASAADVERLGTTGLLGPSLYYSPYNKVWIESVMSFYEGSLMMRTASRPEGPWSTAQALINPAVYFPNDIAYGGWMHPWSERAPQQPNELYFHISGAQAYAPFAFRTAIGAVPVTAAARELPRAKCTSTTRLIAAPGAASAMPTAAVTATRIVPTAAAAQAVPRSSSPAARLVNAGGSARAVVRSSTTIARVIPAPAARGFMLGLASSAAPTRLVPVVASAQAPWRAAVLTRRLVIVTSARARSMLRARAKTGSTPSSPDVTLRAACRSTTLTAPTRTHTLTSSEPLP